MSVLINLLPDIRQAKLRESRRRQLVTGVSIVVWAVCGGVVLLLSLYAGGQKVLISNATRSIANEENQLKSVSGLIDAYTAQQHLASLPNLYAQRVRMTKFFQAYMEADPTDITLTSMTVDAGNTLIVQGSAGTYASVAKLARALQASNISVGTGASASNSPNFSNVTITSVGTSGASGRKGVNFSINATVESGATSGGQ